ncbi:dTDP-4-dehydrorhamnose reductase [Thermosulfurimonas dismutans]|uniref:dTDP-4-dehydrorhamnose reductase n=1 Tax=Thermosulfurimonas dismutans TaxID=999894 RepID=A0A179D1C5_9BACT|nr:dTDP-4-dehydrorhamnose reductase [Thermosulfurimonas dismutans]OAQ19865.1 dTDP-4-dehydrorhamnose reductase [Thermosulfurimonas dismutans]
MGLKIALFGAGGQLGSDLVKICPSEVELVPLTRKEVDVTDRGQVLEVLRNIKPDLVLNATAYVKVDQAEDEVEAAFAVNAAGVRNLVEGCLDTGSVLLHVSTDYVFDGGKLDARDPYTEEDPENPINIYGLSKYAGEVIVRNYLERFYIVRVASLYGKAGASGKGGNFVYTILRKARAGEPLRVVDDIFMSPTYTLDAAHKIWEIVLEERPYGLYHLTNSGYCSWYEFTKKILEYARLDTDLKPIKHTEFKTKARRPLWSPLRSVKGITMRSWQEALEAFISEVTCR